MTLARHPAVLALTLMAASPVHAAGLGELGAARQECIAAARDTQQREQAVLAIEHDVDLLTRDAEARQRGLDETRTEQAHLLATLVYIARHPPNDRLVLAAGTSLDRVRGDALMQEADPALKSLTRALSAEIARVASLRQRAGAKDEELKAARLDLAAERQRLTQVVWRRSDLTRQLSPDDPAASGRVARLGREATVGDLIKTADAAADRRDKDMQSRARPSAKKGNATAVDSADPTRPLELKTLALNPDDAPQPLLVTPVVGTVTHRFGETGMNEAQIAGLSLAPLEDAAVVAPFDGRIVYAGPFHDFGLVLIIRHLGGHHSVLTGLDRVDVKIDQWIQAGEPLGAMPAAIADAPGSVLYFELRRDGRPVDPQPWLASRDDGRGEMNGDQKVRQ